MATGSTVSNVRLEGAATATANKVARMTCIIPSSMKSTVTINQQLKIQLGCLISRIY